MSYWQLHFGEVAGVDGLIAFLADVDKVANFSSDVPMLSRQANSNTGSSSSDTQIMQPAPPASEDMI